MRYTLVFLTALIVFGAAMARPAQAQQVYVGYSDGLRTGGFFPNPWQGSANVQGFQGTADGNDAGAILFKNTTGATINVSNIGVTINPGSGPQQFNLWSNFSLDSGMYEILTQTGNYNFDTSDFAYKATGDYQHTDDYNSPLVTFTTNGSTTTTLKDTGHVLDTYGFDLAAYGNESIGWQPIGTGSSGRTNNFNPVPEPAFFQMGGLLVMGCVGYIRRRKMNA